MIFLTKTVPQYKSSTNIVLHPCYISKYFRYWPKLNFTKMYSVQSVVCVYQKDWLWMLIELNCHLIFMLACSIYHDILSIESWIVKLYAAASEMRDSESHSSRVETVIELYKRSRGVEKRRVYYQFNHWSVFPQNFKLKEFAEQIVELPGRREKIWYVECKFGCQPRKSKAILCMTNGSKVLIYLSFLLFLKDLLL